MALTLVCDGLIEVTSEGAAVCSTGWLTQMSVPPFDISQIDPAVVTAMFGAGFILCIPPWVAAFGISKIIKMLR